MHRTHAHVPPRVRAGARTTTAPNCLRAASGCGGGGDDGCGGRCGHLVVLGDRIDVTRVPLLRAAAAAAVVCHRVRLLLVCVAAAVAAVVRDRVRLHPLPATRQPHASTAGRKKIPPKNKLTRGNRSSAWGDALAAGGERDGADEGTSVGGACTPSTDPVWTPGAAGRDVVVAVPSHTYKHDKQDNTKSIAIRGTRGFTRRHTLAHPAHARPGPR